MIHKINRPKYLQILDINIRYIRLHYGSEVGPNF